MRNATSRMNALNAQGMDTNNMISFALKNGGTLNMSIVNGNNDAVIEEIKSNGTVENNHLFRRWVCAQMLRNLWDMDHSTWRRADNFSQYLDEAYRFSYQMKMMEDEYNTMAHMKHDGDAELEMRSLFFSPSRVALIYKEITEIITEYCEEQSRNAHHKCRGVVYAKIGGVNMFLDDVKKFEHKLNKIADEIEILSQHGNLYREMRDAMIKYRNALPWGMDRAGLKKSRTWIDCFKGAGAYYTLQNLILFHKAIVVDYKTCKRYSGEDAYEYLQSVAKENPNSGYYLFGMMKDVLDFNGININNLY